MNSGGDAPAPVSVGAVVVTHGGLAIELLEATARIVGSTEYIRAVSIDWDDEVADAHDQIEKAIAAVAAPGGVLIFTDMFGGTPTNVSLSFLEAGSVEILTGVNLPMLVKLANLQGSGAPLEEIARLVRDRGQQSVYVASEILSRQEEL